VISFHVNYIVEFHKARHQEAYFKGILIVKNPSKTANKVLDNIAKKLA
jgi:hypothetical protein